MNKPAHPLTPDPDIGPLDEHGQQIWSPEEEAAIARIEAEPGFLESLKEAEAGPFYTSEEVKASMVEMKRKWFADKGVTPPPGYFAS